VVDQSLSYGYYDQRFGPRIVDNPNKANAATGPYAGADIGSVELTLAEGPQATPAAPPPPPPVNHKKKCKKKKHKRSATAAKKCKKKKRSASADHPWHYSEPSRVARAGEHHAFQLRP
jgi:hypothetical protein